MDDDDLPNNVRNLPMDLPAILRMLVPHLPKPSTQADEQLKSETALFDSVVLTMLQRGLPIEEAAMQATKAVEVRRKLKTP